MKFVVGRKYRTRNGREVLLVEDDGTQVPYMFDDRMWRFRDGTVVQGQDDPDDIVSIVGTYDESSPLIKAARHVVELHDNGKLTAGAGDSIAIEALRKALEDDNG